MGTKVGIIIEKDFWDYLMMVCISGCGLIGFFTGILRKRFELAFILFVLGLVAGFFIFYLLFVGFAPKARKEAHRASMQEIKEKKEKERDQQERQRINEMSQLGVKCSTCNSNNIERISTAKKAAYVAATGILAPAFKKVRSQFECKNCGCKW